MSTSQHQAVRLLDRAISLTHKYGHSKSVLARSRPHNSPCSIDDPEATSFCIIGFLGRARHELGLSNAVEQDADCVTRDALFARTGSRFLATYSDADDTTINEVRSLFVEAKALYS